MFSSDIRAYGLRVNCNLCGSPPDRHELRFERDGHEIDRCEACGLLFRRELPSREELGEIYSESYWRRPDEDTGGQGYADYLGEEEVHRANARKRLRALSQHVSGGRLLDVGCAAGFFLDEAVRVGWRGEGVELSAAMAAHARDNLGLEVAEELFQDSEPEAGAFDCVTMWDYVEHSLDPSADLAKAREALRPGGLVAISTGDAGSLVARLSGKRWHLLTPRHHNFFFTRSTLRAMLVEHGFEPLTVRHPAALYTVGYATHKLRTMRPGSRILQALARWGESSRAGRFTIPLNLWDIVTITARRS